MTRELLLALFSAGLTVPLELGCAAGEPGPKQLHPAPVTVYRDPATARTRGC